MIEVSITDAKRQLPELVDRAHAGAEFVITRSGTPVARLVPLDWRQPRRVPGGSKGRIFIHDDFDALPDEIRDAFAGLDP